MKKFFDFDVHEKDVDQLRVIVETLRAYYKANKVRLNKQEAEIKKMMKKTPLFNTVEGTKKL